MAVRLAAPGGREDSAARAASWISRCTLSSMANKSDWLARPLASRVLVKVSMGSFFFQISSCSDGTYRLNASDSVSPSMRMVTASMMVILRSVLARSSAAETTSCTATTSVPSTRHPSTSGPYARARRASVGAANCRRLGVPKAHWLFSMTITRGSRSTDAMLSASWKSPVLVEPSPMKASTALLVSRYTSEKAQPDAVHTSVPR